MSPDTIAVIKIMLVAATCGYVAVLATHLALWSVDNKREPFSDLAPLSLLLAFFSVALSANGSTFWWLFFLFLSVVITISDWITRPRTAKEAS